MHKEGVAEEAQKHSVTVNDKMHKLNDSTALIHQVVDLINDLSEQTNLLALNGASRPLEPATLDAALLLSPMKSKN